MPSPSDLRARREALATQRSSGVARVSYDGKTVDYRSVAEIDLAKLDPQAGWTEDVAQTARLVFVVTPRAEAPAETKQEAPVTKGRRELRVYNVALVLGERRAPRSLELQTLLSELGADEDETRRALDPDVLLEMLRENIAPTRERARLIVHKGSDHHVERLELRKR